MEAPAAAGRTRPAASDAAAGEDAHMITSSEATFRALLSSSIADDGERERLAAELARASEVEVVRSEEHTSELQSLRHLVCRLLLEKKKKKKKQHDSIKKQ